MAHIIMKDAQGFYAVKRPCSKEIEQKQYFDINQGS